MNIERVHSKINLINVDNFAKTLSKEFLNLLEDEGIPLTDESSTTSESLFVLSAFMDRVKHKLDFEVTLNVNYATGEELSTKI